MRSIGHTLTSLTDIRPLMERVHTLVAMQRRYAAALSPDLVARSRISHERGGTIFVQADTPAVAAKLRNLTTRIFQDLRTEWPNLTGIQISTQPTPRSANAARQPRQMDEEGRRQLHELSESLPEGSLKASLQKWSLR